MIDIYKLIMLDADNTLFDFSKSESSALEKTMKAHSLDYDESRDLIRYKKYNQIMWERFEKGEASIEEVHSERWRMFLPQLDLDCKELDKEYLEFLSHESHLFDGAYETVKGLYEKGYKLTIVTNGSKSVQERRFASSDIIKYFDNIVISSDIGIAKPHRGIFEHAARLSDVTNKNEILMVGDSIYADIKGGIDFGIDTCFLNLYDMEIPKEIVPKYVIKDIQELRVILL